MEELPIDRLFCGDAAELSKKLLPDNSIHGIATDPPYGLEFMGEEWDKFTISHKRIVSDVKNYQEWTTAWAREALRVLKPGASMLVMGGTRTHHRMACGVEDAGFTIKDTLLWCYNCLSSDTEIFIRGEWEQYNKAKQGDMVLCFSKETGELKYAPIEEVFIYDFEGELIRIHSNKTDQLVTPNHNCIVRSEGKYQFARADFLEEKTLVPVLAKVHLPRLREELLATPRLGEEMQSQLLLQTMQRKGQNIESPSSVESDGLQNLDERTQGNPTAKDDGREKLGLEGGRDVFQDARKICGSQVCSLPEEIYQDGSEGWLCDGTPTIGGNDNRSFVGEARGSSSHRPRSNQQQPKQLGVMGEQPTAQEARGQKQFRIETTLATKSTVKYKGKVWCVKVPAGAFVARRNGQIFITGNSGFPKSQDLGKMLDKRAGAEREIVGKNPHHRTTDALYKLGFQGGRGDGNITTPATPLAREWDGWKVGGLKPSYEPIVWAVKPPEGAIIDNVLKHGVGAVNVDACRIPFENEDDQETARYNALGMERLAKKYGEKLGTLFEGGWEKHKLGEQPEGRYPANMIRTDRFEDGYDRFYFVPKASRSERDAGLEGISQSEIQHSVFDRCAKCGGLIINKGKRPSGCTCDAPTRVGNKLKNIHPTVKPVALMEHLIKLVTRKGQIVLDPFVGSGTTCIAARKLLRHYIGFDNNAEYIKIAKHRLATVPKPLEDY